MTKLPTENDVIAVVQDFLCNEGWTISQSRNTQQTGIDLIAVRAATGRCLYVEAKGATSSKPGTARYGKPFNSAQVKDHVANVFYEACRVAEEGSAAVAIPRTDLHKRYMQPIRRSLEKLNIAVFWIDVKSVVDTWNWNAGA